VSLRDTLISNAHQDSPFLKSTWVNDELIFKRYPNRTSNRDSQTEKGKTAENIKIIKARIEAIDHLSKSAIEDLKSTTRELEKFSSWAQGAFWGASSFKFTVDVVKLLAVRKLSGALARKLRESKLFSVRDYAGDFGRSLSGKSFGIVTGASDVAGELSEEVLEQFLLTELRDINLPKNFGAVLAKRDAWARIAGCMREEAGSVVGSVIV